jgi:hypothetical protein
MALTITNDFSMGAGGKAFRFYTITHDATVLDVSAHLLDLKHIDWVGTMGTVMQSDYASTGSLVICSITGGGTVVNMNTAAVMLAGDKTRIMVLGW